MAFDLGGFGSLLGGISALFGGGNTTKQSWKGAYGSLVGHAEGAIEGYKRTGINPLTLLGVTPSSGLPGQNYFGQAVADAGMLLADAFASREDVGRLERAERLNEKLRKQVTDLTLRPAVPGVYGAGNGGGYVRGPDGSREAGAAGASADRGGPVDHGHFVPSGDDYDLAEDGGAQSDDNRAPAEKPLKFFGLNLWPNSETTDAGVWEQRYGEDSGILPSPGALAGWSSFANDLLSVPTNWLPQGRYMDERISLDDHPVNPYPPEAPEKPRYKTAMRNGKRVRVRKSAWDK